jgi:hypothetical protein
LNFIFMGMWENTDVSPVHYQGVPVAFIESRTSPSKCYSIIVRTAIKLTEVQLRALRRLATENGKPIADLVRQGVDLYLSAQNQPVRQEQVRRALRVAGRFSSESRNGSAEHDRHLAAAFRC